MRGHGLRRAGQLQVALGQQQFTDRSDTGPVAQQGIAHRLLTGTGGRRCRGHLRTGGLVVGVPGLDVLHDGLPRLIEGHGRALGPPLGQVAGGTTLAAIEQRLAQAEQQAVVVEAAGGSTGCVHPGQADVGPVDPQPRIDIEHRHVQPVATDATAEQHDDLLNEAQAISLDYNTRPVLVDGRITAFMGFNFVHCERLGVDASSYRRVPVYAKSGVHLGMWNDINTQISERADKGYSTQVYCKGTFGATRTEEKKVVEILCQE